MANHEVWLDKENIYVRNSEGQTASKPISRFKRLMQATEEQRNAFELSSSFRQRRPQLTEKDRRGCFKMKPFVFLGTDFSLCSRELRGLHG